MQQKIRPSCPLWHRCAGAGRLHTTAKDLITSRLSRFKVYLTSEHDDKYNSTMQILFQMTKQLFKVSLAPVDLKRKQLDEQ
jgi:NADPH-dependent 7-cyano-7-deazaguanine reductase QueF-like protein